MDEGADGLMADTLITGTTLVEKESRSIGDVPIGGIVAWVKTLAGVPNLAEGWVECDGSVLVDALSPLNGQTIPDLNGGVFLEGRATSGATGGSATNVHNIISKEAGVEFTTGSGNVVDDAFIGGTPETDALTNSVDNRPPFYTVVWIMRVR